MDQDKTTRPVILLVDDDQDVRETFAEILEDDGFEVRVAADGRQAMTLLATVRPCLILLDWMMPVMSGEQVLAAIRADASLAKIPLMVLTASHPKEVAAMGAPVLRKPVTLEDLVQLVRKHCDGPGAPHRG